MVDVSVSTASLQKGYEFLLEEVAWEAFDGADLNLPMGWMRLFLGVRLADVVNVDGPYSYVAGNIKSDETGSNEDFFAFAAPLLPLQGRQRLTFGTFDLVQKDERTAAFRPRIGSGSGASGRIGEDVHCNVKLLERDYLVCSSHVAIADSLGDFLVTRVRRPTGSIVVMEMDGKWFREEVAETFVDEYLSFTQKTVDIEKISEQVLEHLERVRLKVGYQGNRLRISMGFEWNDENETLSRLIADDGGPISAGISIPSLPSDRVSSVLLEHVDLDSLSDLLASMDIGGNLFFDGGKASTAVLNAIEDGYADGAAAEDLFIAYGRTARSCRGSWTARWATWAARGPGAGMLGWYVLGVEGDFARLSGALEHEIGYREEGAPDEKAGMSVDDEYRERATLVPISRKERLPEGTVHLVLERVAEAEPEEGSRREAYSSNEAHLYFLDAGEGIWSSARRTGTSLSG